MMAAAALALGATACDDFLERPVEDSYNTSNYYQNDAQLYQSVNSLYNSPWYDFQRGFIKVGEVFSGNLCWGSSPYLTFTVNSTDEDLVNMSASLWSVNAHANTQIKNITELAGPATSEAARNAARGEALTWKAMAYFYMVRTFGAVPIVHDNSALIGNNSYNSLPKASIPSVYEYIIMTLEKAIEWLPEKAALGRIDKYCAEGLLAKVYLTKSGYGMKGSRNAEDLAKAAEYAKDVIENSGRILEPDYATIFQLKGNNCSESLLAWRWTAEGGMWTSQNSLASDLGLVGIAEDGFWGGYTGVSVDLMNAFGDDPLKKDRNNRDLRRKATVMMAGDHIDYFWQNYGGFEMLDFTYGPKFDKDYKDNHGGLGGNSALQSNTGGNVVKHIYGNNFDHTAGIGYPASKMASSLATHILRLADVYLVYAEAVLGNNAKTTDASALAAFNAVCRRGIPSWEDKAEISFNDIWQQRRLELALEGDRWYDYVRLAYYNPDAALAELKAQKRSTMWNLDGLYSTYYETGVWEVNLEQNPPMYAVEAGQPMGQVEMNIQNINSSIFTLPFPDTDLAMNPLLRADPVDVDVRAEYAY